MARRASALLGIRYGSVVCKYATAAVALKPVLLIERLSVVDNASGIAATAWLKTRAVGDSSDVGRCTKSERLEVCELIAHSPLSVNFGMNVFIGCAHETRAIAPLSDVIAASRARRTGAERVDAIENAATSVLAQRGSASLSVQIAILKR